MPSDLIWTLTDASWLSLVPTPPLYPCQPHTWPLLPHATYL
jgi:hypothetical protein